MSRPAHEPTDKSRKQVEALAGYGLSQDKIARIVGIAEKTLRAHYREELEVGQDKANSLVAQSLFSQATKGSGAPAVTAAIFWLKTRAGWKETQRLEHGGDVNALLEAIDGATRGIPGRS